MRQLPENSYERTLEQRLQYEIDTLRKETDARLQPLELPVFEATSYASPPNYLPNSHPVFSTLAYGTAGTTPATAGDTNHEAYNWYTQTVATTNLSGSLVELVGPSHSTYGGLNADSCTWDRTNGTFLLGSSSTNYDIACPLPTDFVYPGQRYYVYFEASLGAADTDIDEAQFYAGFWDDTAGQEKWIEGADFTPTISVYGSEGARTLEYKIHALTDAGTEILSAAVSTTTAPATLTAENHVRLTFDGAPGFIQYIIYRKDGSNYYRIGDIRNSIDLQFFDIQETGSTVVPVTGYPSVTGNRPKAYVETVLFDPAATGSFRAHTAVIQVPLTYNRSLTGNLQQWFRFGLTSLVGAAGSRREVIIRRIAVSEGYGAWTPAPRDMQAASGPSGGPTTGPGPSTPPTTNPPGSGTGGPVCLVLDTNVDTADGTKRIGDIEERKDWMVCGPMALPVKRIEDGIVQFVWEIETECGRIVQCSDSHKWPTSLKDRKGRTAGMLKVGDALVNREFELTTIIRKDRVLATPEQIRGFGGIPVRRIWLPYPNLFIANELVTLNAKPVTANQQQS